jgi:hypothetical protein
VSRRRIGLRDADGCEGQAGGASARPSPGRPVGIVRAVVGPDTEGIKSRRDSARNMASFCSALAVIASWLGTSALAWKIVVVAGLSLGLGLFVQSIALRVQEREANGLPTGPISILTASIWLPGVVLITLAVAATVLAKSL